MTDQKKPNFVLSIVGIIILLALVYHYTAVYFERKHLQENAPQNKANGAHVQQQDAANPNTKNSQPH